MHIHKLKTIKGILRKLKNNRIFLIKRMTSNHSYQIFLVIDKVETVNHNGNNAIVHNKTFRKIAKKNFKPLTKTKLIKPLRITDNDVEKKQIRYKITNKGRAKVPPRPPRGNITSTFNFSNNYIQEHREYYTRIEGYRGASGS